jgi:predicted Zn-dependent protease with MMP-like domain
MDHDSFEKLVLEALKDLPTLIRKKLENVELIIEDLADSEILREMNISSPYHLFGLYRGIPFSRRGHWYGNVLPDTIIIYQKPIESACRDKNEIKAKVQEVVAHEIGHYFGFSEKKLRKLGY